MRRFIMVTAAAAAVATLGALSPATAGAAGHALRAGSRASARAGQAASGAVLWFRQYNGPTNAWNGASSVAVSRDGTRVFVTGLSQDGIPGANDYATVAYSAATGRNLWIRRYISGNAWGSVLVAVSRTRVFVTGTILGQPGSAHYATVAYSAAAGRKLWVRQFNHAPGASSIAVNAAGTAVFVTGSGGTVAYSAVTGRQLWSRGGGYSVAVNHRGTAVFVADGSNMAAYNAATGRQLWAWDHAGNGLESGFSVAVNATGTVVFVTGTATGTVPGQEYATAAYSASTGKQLWASYYALAGDTNDSASSVVVNPAGTEVFVTGVRGTQYQYGGDYATVAYDAATGSQLWARGYAGATYDQNTSEFLSPALALSPDGTTVYLTGSSGGYRTFAYNAATGTTLWARHYRGPKGTGDAAAIAVSPRGTAVFVTGTTGRTGEYGTIAYRS
jgi:outer membrane protein assembly factor BamB